MQENKQPPQDTKIEEFKKTKKSGKIIDEKQRLAECWICDYKWNPPIQPNSGGKFFPDWAICPQLDKIDHDKRVKEYEINLERFQPKWWHP